MQRSEKLHQTTTKGVVEDLFYCSMVNIDIDDCRPINPIKYSSDIQVTSLAMKERKLPGASGAIHKLARARHALTPCFKATHLQYPTIQNSP